ncbi:hydrogenase maturation protease [Streptomyces sp. NBC_01381]|uniref:hydrogenase maturation protease n=1 Tax=Streptomyces sp. NBC_01381 TaxID=2903845 RepID=UPI002257E3C4|nr:hydrogenase maturation protease [Streptomyces sp. NBC_01381]MCX4673714.1 hydrogenase maturation protease [Streptomyces sp. NBC_01381]
MPTRTHIAVIGVGNEFRRDDGLGWAVIARFRERAAERPLPAGTVLATCDGDPARLIGLREGSDLAVVVDAAHAHPAHPGRVHRLALDADAPARPGTTGSHGLGLGGTATELLADRAARLAPLTDLDVHDLIASPRCAPLLFGHGGTGPVGLEGLEQLLHRLSRMACDLPQLAEADFNPVLAWPGGTTALDVRVRLLPRTSHDPYLRRLR